MNDAGFAGNDLRVTGGANLSEENEQTPQRRAVRNLAQVLAAGVAVQLNRNPYRNALQRRGPLAHAR
ncbi:MAG: hypothetical protein ACOY0T_20270 [Myxococcota bacterium]